MEDLAQPTTSLQAPSVSPEQNLSSYGKKNWKKWVLIYLVIGVVLYGLVYYFVLSKQSLNPYSTNYTAPTVQPTQVQDASPVPNGTGETANWKTYTNTLEGYSFKYPNDYSVYSDKSNPPIINIIPISSVATKERRQTISIYLAQSVFTNLTIDEYVQKRLDGQKYEPIIIDGLEGGVIRNIGCFTTCDLAFVKTTKGIYEISLHKDYLGQEDEKNYPGKIIPQSIFNQILFTFKFTQ